MLYTTRALAAVIFKLLLLWLLFITNASFAQKDSAVIIRETEGFQQFLNSEYHNAATSPLSAEQRKKFKGHHFFPIDMQYVVKAKLITNAGDKKIMMATSGGGEKEFIAYGKVLFKLHDSIASLIIYKPASGDNIPDDYYFIPFRDETSGVETYGGGRYLDVTAPAGDSVMLNFNKCYNPYCAYVSGYACPIPPAANFIHQRVEAGIKLP